MSRINLGDKVWALVKGEFRRGEVVELMEYGDVVWVTGQFFMGVINGNATGPAWQFHEDLDHVKEAIIRDIRMECDRDVAKVECAYERAKNGEVEQ